MKLWKNVALFALAGPLCLAAQTTNGSTTPKSPAPSNQPSQSNMMNGGKAECSQLNPDEQEFATQLSTTQRMMFCNKFTPEMRASAMEASGQMGTNGMLITNDQAVEQVAKDNNMMMPMSPTKRQGSACPAK